MSNLCTQCGAPIKDGAVRCEYCGGSVAQTTQQPAQQPLQSAPRTAYQQTAVLHPERANWPYKSKVVAAVLAFILGGIGIHKFYLGRTGAGIMYLLFCWTYIPAFLAFFDAIILLCSNDENFMTKYRCRVN